MAKGSNSLNSKRSRKAKPYDANNSFVKKVANKVTDFIPQHSWISKWFNTSRDDCDTVNDNDNPEDSENDEETTQPPPLKRPRIRMDVTHPPGTFNIQPRNCSLINRVKSNIEEYPNHNETENDFLEPPIAGSSGTRRLIASTPAAPSDLNVQQNRAELNSMSLVQNNGVSNGADDNSESSESTSGCSSLIPQVNRQEAPSDSPYNRPINTRKRFMDDKLNFTNHLQSPRSMFLDVNSKDSLSSRRPSFNASVMNTSLDRKTSFASPFYNGNTTFGGANTAGFNKRGRTLFNGTNEQIQLKVPTRTTVQVKSPSNAAGTDSSGMSQTAKRILEALEYFSSPILDAKKIPVNTSTNEPTTSGKKRQRSETGTPRARVGLRHMIRELNVPTVPDMLKLRHRQRLQDTTAAVRKIASAHNTATPASQEYHLRSAHDEKSAKYSGKIKAKDKSDINEENTVEAVNLPNIALPITTLPSFNISLPNANRDQDLNEQFKFTSPIKVTETSKNLKSINNFTFSKPINAGDKQTTDNCQNLSQTLSLGSNTSTMASSSKMTSNSMSSNSMMTSNSMIGSNFMWSGASTAPKMKASPKIKESKPDGVAVADDLKSGSVMDFLGKTSDPLMDAWKPAAGIWECNQCLIRNSKDETQCLACKAPKASTKIDKTSSDGLAITTTASSSSTTVTKDCFGSQFKMTSNLWECGACSVRNKQTDIKCVSCTTAKPGSEKTTTVKQPSNVIEFNKSDSIMDKFKPVEGSWECPGCLLRNPGTITTCPCCEASKPGSLKISPKRSTMEVNSQAASSPSSSKIDPNADKTKNVIGAKKDAELPASGFGDKFKKPANSWTCDECMIQNAADTSECLACSAARPGSKKVSKTESDTSSVQFNSGVSNKPSGFKFGIDNNVDQADSQKSVLGTGGFTFGTKLDTVKTEGFTFGIPQDHKKAPTTADFTFGVPTTEVKVNTETTEVPSESKKHPLSSDQSKTAPSFSFGQQKTAEPIPTSEKQFAFNAESTTTAITQPSFTFGATKSLDTTVSTTDKVVPKVGFKTSDASVPQISFSTSDTAKSDKTTNKESSQLQTAKVSNDANDVKPASTVTFRISTNPATTTNAATPSLFTFGSTPATGSLDTTASLDTTQSSNFAQPPTTVSNSSSLFVFGSAKPSEAPSACQPEKFSLPAFAATSTPFNTQPSLFATEKDKPAFDTVESKPTLFGNVEAKTSVFGGNDAKTAFENPNKKTAPPAFNSATPTFGAPLATPAFGSTTPAFGTATSSAFGTNAPPKMFPASKPAESVPAPNPGLFTFGGNNLQATPQTSSAFMFSGSNNTTAPQPAAPQEKSLFAFGAGSAAPPVGNGFGNPSFNAPADLARPPFAFNAPKLDNLAFGQSTPAPTSSMFGGPSQPPPSFGQTQTTPAFGSAPQTLSGGFSFGGAAPAAAPGFNFGAPPTSAPAPGGFTFNAPNSTPAIAFDPNTRPTFNFTRGSAPATFNAPPQSAPPRKIKKAVRRTQPR